MADVAAPKAPWVLLRGLSRAAVHWGDFPQQLAHATGRRVLCIDLPGNGTAAGTPSPTDVAAMARYARRQLRAAGLAGPVHLLALSLGGMVACHWATAWPQEVRSAVLVNSSLRGLSPWHQRLRPAVYPALLRLMLLPVRDAVWEDTVYRLTSQRPERREATVRRWTVLRQAQPVSRLNVLRQLLAAARYCAPPEAPPVPLLVLNSRGDRLVAPACSLNLARRWGASLAMHPDAGHDLPLDAPEWVLAELKRWCVSLEGPSGLADS